VASSKRVLASIVIPAFNEQSVVGRQIACVRANAPAGLAEIIVVDNCSVDATVEVAKAAGADIVVSTPGTISEVRNFGVSRAGGDVLIFLDADVFPTLEWGGRITAVVSEVIADPLLITGSWVSIPRDATWIERHWFKPLQAGSRTHMNSGHLIMSRVLFERLHGFDPRLRTGEDFDLSTRAIQQGARLVNDAELVVEHEGYPKTLGQFFRREMWHGMGDFASLPHFLRSKLAIVGVALLHLLVAGAITSALTRNGLWLAGAILIALLGGSAAAWIRYRDSSRVTRMVNSGLYSVYFIARGASLYAALASFSPKRRSGTARH
jgi:glycosyltransferase involved in cell wall biosynthesis